jgi:endonuclease/exonuclease/phosphatase family metal-dependent hydrolase
VTCFQTFAAIAALAIAVPAGAAPTCEPIRVMTYNIRLDLESDGVNRWAKRRDQLIGQVKVMQPAILGLQEVVPGQKSDLGRMLPNYTLLGLPRGDGKMKGESSNLAIDRSVLRVRSSGTFWLSETPAVPSKGWDAAYPRVATWARLVRRSDGRRILALNTHLDNAGEQARLQGARQIAAWLEANRIKGESIIVTGDFNAEHGSLPVRELTQGELGLRDAHDAAQLNVGPAGTFNDFKAVPDETHRIDYILADPSLYVRSHAVLAWLIEGGRVASDHFPVVADLSSCPG